MNRDDIIDMALAGKQSSLRDRISYAIALEREACAKVCEEADIREFAMGDQPYPEWYAKLIRARREQ